MKLISM